MTSMNEIAERLLSIVNRSSLMDEALAAERRATVERIRAEFDGRTWHPDDLERISRILDEEAARG